MNQSYSSTNTTQNLTIHYDKKTSTLITVVGFLLLILGFKFGLIFYAIGLACAIRGALYLKNPAYFSISNDELSVYGPTGKKTKIYHFDSPTDLKVENNKIYLQTHERKKKLPIGKWLIDRGDWNSFLEKISDRT